jgi:hypothetical protein
MKRRRERMRGKRKSKSALRRAAARFRPARRLRNGDVVATKQATPFRRVVRDVNGVVLYVEHLTECEQGTVVHDAAGKGLYDRETSVSFRNAFSEKTRSRGRSNDKPSQNIDV